MRPLANTAFLALLAAVLLESGPAQSQGVGSQRGQLPLVDAHIHYSAPDWASHPPERVLDILARAGIQRAVVSSTPDDGTLALYEKDPRRIVPMLRPYRTREDMGTWWDDPTVIPYLEARLKRRGHRGIGEFHLPPDHAPTPGVKRPAAPAPRRGPP